MRGQARHFAVQIGRGEGKVAQAPGLGIAGARRRIGGS